MIHQGKSILRRQKHGTNSGLEKHQAPWHLRWFYGVMRKMFGKDLTPVKLQMRVPGIVWGSIGMDAGLVESGACLCGWFNWPGENGGARRLSFLSGYQFCRGQKSSFDDEKLLAVKGGDLSTFNEKERLVIELADAMADTPAMFPKSYTLACANIFPKNSCSS